MLTGADLGSGQEHTARNWTSPPPQPARAWPLVPGMIGRGTIDAAQDAHP